MEPKAPTRFGTSATPLIGALLTDPSVYEDIKRLVGDLERNDILRALVRYSIRRDEPREPVEVTEE